MLREREGCHNRLARPPRSQCTGGRTVERPYTDAELAAFREGLADLGLTCDQLTASLGGANRTTPIDNGLLYQQSDG